jgi:hypothetical protein
MSAINDQKEIIDAYNALIFNCKIICERLDIDEESKYRIKPSFRTDRNAKKHNEGEFIITSPHETIFSHRDIFVVKTFLTGLGRFVFNYLEDKSEKDK